MKKVIFYTIIIIMLMFGINVKAANKVATPGDADFDTLKNQYLQGIQTKNISSSGIVTLYGYSSCTAGSCTYKYSNTSSDYKEVLKRTVVCSGGEKNIIYQTTGGADGYKEDNKANHNGDAYWTEDFSITCTNTQTSSTIQIDNTPSGGTNNGGSNGGSYGNQNGGTNGGTSGGSTGGYTSAGTTDPSATGVETYYIILGIVGLISYFLTITIKKYNLFKKV